MILEYSIEMIHAVSATIMQKAEQTFSMMLTGALKEKLAEQAMANKKFMEGKFSIEDNPTNKGQKTYIGEDGFVGNLTKIMTRRYAFKQDKLMGEDVMLSDMASAIILELQKPMYLEAPIRISPANVFIRMQKDEIHIHAEIFIALPLEEAKVEEKV